MEHQYDPSALRRAEAGANLLKQCPDAAALIENEDLWNEIVDAILRWCQPIRAWDPRGTAKISSVDMIGRSKGKIQRVNGLADNIANMQRDLIGVIDEMNRQSFGFILIGDPEIIEIMKRNVEALDRIDDLLGEVRFNYGGIVSRLSKPTRNGVWVDVRTVEWKFEDVARVVTRRWVEAQLQFPKTNSLNEPLWRFLGALLSTFGLEPMVKPASLFGSLRKWRNRNFRD